jgi:hypothetical protein
MALPKSVQDSEAADERRRAARRKRYALRAGLWRLSSLKGVKGCARNAVTGGHVTLVRGASGAGYEGVQLCSNLWACPCCSARIRQSRAQDVERAALAHLNGGGHLLFLTLTMPHDHDDALADTLDAGLASWRDVQQSSAWRRPAKHKKGPGLKVRLGLDGFIRATEVTYTALTDQGSGWHPHLHLLLFVDHEHTQDSLDAITGELHAAWSHQITRRGFRSPSTALAPNGGQVGVNLRPVEGVTGSSKASSLAAYLTKVQDGWGDSWSVGSEMLRGDLKSGRRALSVTPFDIAAQALGVYEDADGIRQPARPERVQLWHEYETATKSRKAIHWSDGLRARYLTDDEVEDQAVPAFDAALWRQVCRRPLWPVHFLEYAEAGDFQAIEDCVEAIKNEGTGWHWQQDPGRRAS